MRKLLVLTAILAISNCGKDKAKSEDTSIDLEPVQAQAKLYESDAEPMADASGFVDTQADKCDSLLTSCFAYVAGSKVDYKEAEDPADRGRWYRDSGRSCSVSAGNTAAGFSRDMALGLLLCLVQDGNVSLAKEFVDYVDAHKGLMSPDGDGHINSMQPLVHYLYTSFIAKNSSIPPPAHPDTVDPGSATGQADLTELTGSDAHLAVFGVLLDGMIHGSILEMEAEFINDQVKRQPRNGFFQFVAHHFGDGKQQTTLAAINDMHMFPAGRLPNSGDRSSYYLWERDAESADWQPSPDPEITFSGTDYRLVVALLSGKVRGI